MECYGDILDRIVEMLDKAQLSRRKNSKHLASFKGYYVLKSDILEFTKLLQTENTFYKLSTLKDTTQKNDQLLKLCQVRSSIQNEFTSDYLQLIEILQSAYSKKANELIEHLGYFIPVESINTFHEICYKLKIGPSVLLRDIYSQEAKEAINDYLYGNVYQLHRIQNYALTSSKAIEKAPTVKEDLTTEELVVYLAERKDLNINSLELFIPILGLYNYYELIKGLYELNVIDRESFIKISKQLLDYDELFSDVITQYVKLTVEDTTQNITK